MNTRISRILVVVLAFAAVAPVIGQQSHARRVPLEGALNFRDLGGYPTSDGNQVKWGMVYRSNHLANLTATDYQTLNKRGIKLVCDLRTDGERKRSPTMWQGDRKPEIMAASILKDTDVVMTPERLKEITQPRSSMLSETYVRMVTESPDEYGNVLRRLANGGLPAVTHCTAGKDRTGVFSAILLTILRVPREYFVQDYMLNGEYKASEQAHKAAEGDWKKLTNSSTPPDRDILRAIYTMHPEAITGTFEAIDRKYGSFDAFVRDGLKLSEADVQ